MAAPPSPKSPVLEPTPLRSPVSPAVPLHHPTPDLQSLQGAYISNIERLEDRAERMSEAGSDLGEEIRKLQLGQKLAESRRSSLRSAEPSEDAVKSYTGRSRNASVSSYANSIVDVNTAARWGGYSPAGYVTSPGGSIVSSALGSTVSHPPLQRQRSGSRASRLGQVVHMDHEDESYSPVEGPVSPQSYTSAPRSVAQSHRSVSSFTRKYDQIAQEIRDELDDEFPAGAQGEGQRDSSYGPHIIPDPELPDRPPTTASTDTYQQARGMWQDFDGAHCPDTVPEEDPSQLSPNGSRDSSFLRAGSQPTIQAAPPPADGMVFYPAPVPQTLNLPKRLSKVPPANVQAKRRTQVLESMQIENRKSVPWLADPLAEASQPNRKSRQSLANLPPQLRASAFFDRVAPVQEFEVKGESAEQTLDSILEASTHAPVSAFTDHPIVGDVGREVYAPERKAKRASKAVDVDKSDARKSRSSLNLLDTRRNSSGDPLNKLKKRNSSADLNMLTVRASESRMSLGDELDEPNSDARGPEPADDTTPTGRSLAGDGAAQSDQDDDISDEEDEEPRHFGPPTTLLAELQMRKEQQKSRNLTAVKLPNGLRSTLLELDAVREIERKKRMTHKVHLAWEAPAEPGADEEDSDEDVPLGVLYPGREDLLNKKPRASQHVSDWDRPLGLLAQRELEDTEPLSKRRTRLIASDPTKRRTQVPDMSLSHQHLTVPAGPLQPESEEDEEETLAQRLRRLKNRQALDDALDPGIRKSTVSGDFAAEMLNTLGVNDSEKPQPSPSPDQEEEEETLGQRRARLQAEALARGDANPPGSRPPLRGSMSLGNILAAHPVDGRITPGKTSDEMLTASLPPGSLLHQDAQRRSRKEAERMERNHRISSYGSADQPLVTDATKPAPEQAIAANIRAYKDRLAGISPTPPGSRGAIPSMMFNPAMSSPNLSGMGMGMGMATPYGPGGMGIRPTSGFVYPGNGISPVQQQQMMAMNMNMGAMAMPAGPYQQMGGGGMNWRQSSMMNLPMAAVSPMQMQMQAAMDQKQRDMIDQWRNGVM